MIINRRIFIYITFAFASIYPLLLWVGTYLKPDGLGNIIPALVAALKTGILPVISISKQISLANRIESHVVHINEMKFGGLFGYGKASLADVVLSTHNTFVQALASNGIILYLIFVIVIYLVVKRLSQRTAIIMLVFSLTLDVFSFIPNTAAFLFRANESKN